MPGQVSAPAARSRLRNAAARMSMKLPTFISPSIQYRSIDNNHESYPSKATRFSLRIAVLLFLAAFALISGRWIKTHPTFLEDVRIAKILSINARITLHPTIEPFQVSTSQEAPVPKVDISILGAAVAASSTPNIKHGSLQWKTATSASASIPAHPRDIVPDLVAAPRTDELLFAMATTADRAISSAQWWLWPSFLTDPASPCFVLLPPEDANRVQEVTSKLSEKEIHCSVKASETKRYQNRVLGLPREAMKSRAAKSNNIKWLIMGDE